MLRYPDLRVHFGTMSKRPNSAAIIGAGRTGRALGKLLRQSGWQITSVVTRSPATARAAVRAIGAGIPQAGIDARLFDAAVVLIATPDREIAHAAQLLALQARKQAAASRGPSRRTGKPGPLARRIVLHTSGALDRSVLSPLEKLGAATGTLHPLQTFVRGAVPNLKGCLCAVEGTPAALRAARRICRDLGCHPAQLPPAARPAYHAAAALAAGHVLAIVEAATEILVSAGFSRQAARCGLLALTRQTLENFQKYGAQAAWTGPLARGDLSTVRKHQAALTRFPPEFAAAYKAVSRLALRLLRKGGTP